MLISGIVGLHSGDVKAPIHAAIHIHTRTYAHIQAHVRTHRCMRENGREGLVFPILGWVVLLVRLLIGLISLVNEDVLKSLASPRRGLGVQTSPHPCPGWVVRFVQIR